MLKYFAERVSHQAKNKENIAEPNSSDKLEDSLSNTRWNRVHLTISSLRTTGGKGQVQAQTMEKVRIWRGHSCIGSS